MEISNNQVKLFLLNSTMKIPDTNLLTKLSKEPQPYILRQKLSQLGVVGHTLSPSTPEEEAGGSLSSEFSLAWSTKQVPEQPDLHRETLSQNQTKQINILL